MKLSRLFSPRPAVLAGRRLYAAAAAQARTRALYADLGGPDTLEGRFELYTLHVALILRRLKGQGAEASETAQALFDAYEAKLITYEDALRNADSLNDLRLQIKLNSQHSKTQDLASGTENFAIV